MKIEIKKIKLGPGSEETIQYTAELYIDGKNIGYLDNDGKGGMTMLRPHDIPETTKGKWQKLFEAAEEQCKDEAFLKDKDTFTVDGFLLDLADGMTCDLWNEKYIKNHTQK